MGLIEGFFGVIDKIDAFAKDPEGHADRFREEAKRQGQKAVKVIGRAWKAVKPTRQPATQK